MLEIDKMWITAYWGQAPADLQSIFPESIGKYHICSIIATNHFIKTFPGKNKTTVTLWYINIAIE
jgi:hypothetical protein